LNGSQKQNGRGDHDLEGFRHKMRISLSFGTSIYPTFLVGQENNSD